MSRGAVDLATKKGNGSEDAHEKAAGRTGRDKQQAVTKPQMVAEKIDHLEKLCVKAQEASKDYSDAVKKIAEQSGYIASNIRALVQARVKDKFGDKKRDAEQQLELFETVGE